ncbi:MAG: hypothetical protein EOM24_10120, partial [Chloroflexia bacterium]|nr:hypothetical protein [Chloroflexia bacterium]
MGNGDTLRDILAGISRSESGIEWMLNPSEGTGILSYYRNIRTTLPPAMRFIFQARPWTRTGVQPFMASLFAAEEIGHFDLIRIAATRHVRVQALRGDDRAQPIIEFYRVQDISLVPDPDDQIEPHRLLRYYMWYEGVAPTPPTNDDATPVPTWFREAIIYNSRHPRAQVQEFPNGVRIQSQQELDPWYFEIRAPEGHPAAYAYEIQPQGAHNFHVRVVHTRSVRLSGQVIRDREAGVSRIFVEHCQVSRLQDVPAPGRPLDPREFDFEMWSDFEIELSARTQTEIAVAEAAISVLPIVGTLYDVAQLGYM